MLNYWFNAAALANSLKSGKSDPAGTYFTSKKVENIRFFIAK